MAERMVKCVKFGETLPGLEEPPYSGELGQRIFESVSKEAWLAWRDHSKMLVNEFRLDLTRKEHQKVWDTESFYNEEVAKIVADYVTIGSKVVASAPVRAGDLAGTGRN